jgi:hypothetical protein
MYRPPAFRFVDGVSRPGPSSSALSHQDRATTHHPGLVKQAYSAWVMPNPQMRPQKWHITAYFTYADLPHLPTIEHDPILQKIIVPSGIYRTGKTRSRSADDEHAGGSRGTADQYVTNSNSLPSLSTIQSGMDMYPPNPSMPRPPHGARLPEDQRVIQMLNSRHIR